MAFKISIDKRINDKNININFGMDDEHFAINIDDPVISDSNIKVVGDIPKKSTTKKNHSIESNKKYKMKKIER